MPNQLDPLANVTLGIHEAADSAPAHPELPVDDGQWRTPDGCRVAERRNIDPAPPEVHGGTGQDAAAKCRLGQTRPLTLGLRGVSPAGRLTGSHDLAGYVEVLRPEKEDAEVPDLVAENDPWRARDTQHPWCHDLAE